MEFARKMVTQFPQLDCFLATGDAVRQLTDLHHRIIYRNRPLPLPTSFLLDQTGRLVSIYKGPLDVAQFQNDLQLVGADAIGLTAAAGFGGHWASGHWDWRLSLVLAVAVFAGGQIGSRISIRLNKQKFKRGYGWLLVGVAVLMILL